MKIENDKLVYAGLYENSPDLTSVTIEDGMVEICENAFRDFTYLEEVTIP